MLVDTNKRDTAWEIWGHKVSAPIGFSPVGINKIYNPAGELPVAKVAGELNLPYCLSTAGTYRSSERIDWRLVLHDAPLSMSKPLSEVLSCVCRL